MRLEEGAHRDRSLQRHKGLFLKTFDGRLKVFDAFHLLLSFFLVLLFALGFLPVVQEVELVIFLHIEYSARLGVCDNATLRGDGFFIEGKTFIEGDVSLATIILAYLMIVHGRPCHEFLGGGRMFCGALFLWVKHTWPDHLANAFDGALLPYERMDFPIEVIREGMVVECFFLRRPYFLELHQNHFFA